MTKNSTVQATTTTLSPMLMPALVFCADPLAPSIMMQGQEQGWCRSGRRMCHSIRLQDTSGHPLCQVAGCSTEHSWYVTATLLHTGGGSLQSLEGLYLNPMFLQRGLLDQRQQLCVIWITYSYLIWKHCLFYNALLQIGLLSLSNLMQTFILTLQENIFDVHHLVDFPRSRQYVCCKCTP